jgi:hypothetical protein
MRQYSVRHQRWRPSHGADAEAFLVPRMQFYAIEIARYATLTSLLSENVRKFFTDCSNRNHNGLNDWIYEKYQKEQAVAKGEEEGAKS